MISQTELNERVQRWGMRPEVVEKDYVIGWVLWGIGLDPDLADWWAFKGGTCLKKCYLGDYRFSEDLDFTSLPDGTVSAAEVLPALTRMLQRVSDESGIDFQSREPRFGMRDNGTSAEGRIYYRGPRNAPPVRIKLDVTTTDAERVVLPTMWRPVSHEYSDGLPEPVPVRCYGLEEIFAEKVRALGDRCLPRDLYDVVNLFRRCEQIIHADRVAELYVEKCRSKGLPVFTLTDLEGQDLRAEMEVDWVRMLGNQLPDLPPLAEYWDELPLVFEWLGVG